MSSNPTARRTTVFLARGHLLRIRDGRGTRVSAASGVLWITEEGDSNDTVLRAGDTRRIRRSGVTLALAERPTHVVLEVPVGVFLPSSVELAFGDGEPGVRVAFDSEGRLSAHAALRTLDAALRDSIASFFDMQLWREPPLAIDDCKGGLR
jgi:hypothetical protein